MCGKLLVEAITIAIHGGTGFHAPCSNCGVWHKTSEWSSECVKIKHNDLIDIIAKKKTFEEVVAGETQDLKDEIIKLKNQVKSLRLRELKK